MLRKLGVTVVISALTSFPFGQKASVTLVKHPVLVEKCQRGIQTCAGWRDSKAAFPPSEDVNFGEIFTAQGNSTATMDCPTG